MSEAADRAPEVVVRDAAPGDAEATRAIYNVEVEGTTTFDLVPRTLRDQQRWIEEHSGPYPAVVAVSAATGRVLGFGALSPYRPRPAYAPTVEDSVYVASDARGRGVGRLLLEELLRRATAGGFHSVIARIVGANEVSVRLHQACGFADVGVEREVGRKRGRWLDVVVMQKLL